MFKALTQWSHRRALRKGIAQLQKQTIGEIMTTYVVSIRPDETIINTATKMIAEDISCLTVMDGEKLVGILSERDFLRKVPLDKKAFGMKVTDIMTPNVVTVPPSLPLLEGVKIMKEHNFRRLVVADGEKVLGIATQTDFAKALDKALGSYPLDEKFSIGAVMTPKILSATPKESFAKAREKMKKINVGSILIMDKNVPLGIFTEYDVVMQFYDQQGELRIKELSAFMRKHVRAAGPKMSLIAANHLLLEKKMRRLPVVDGEKVVGIITMTDIIRFVYLHLDELAASIEKNPTDAVAKEYPGELRGDHLKVYG